MVGDDLEWIVFGAILANSEYRKHVVDDMFSGDIESVRSAADKEAAMWGLLGRMGVIREGQEKPLDAVIRTLTIRAEEKRVRRELRAIVERAGFGLAQLREVRDRLYRRAQ